MSKPRPALFKWRHFEPEIIVCAARWYLRFSLSYRDVEEFWFGSVDRIVFATQPDFRFPCRGQEICFAGVAAQGYGNLQLSLERQAAFVEEAPDIFLPIPGGWGKMGHTHIRLAAANEDILSGALRVAWKLRAQKNVKKKPQVKG